MTTIQRILYATDFSPISEPAWDSAKQFGRLFGAEVVLLHVVQPPPVLLTEGYFPPERYDELIQSARREAEAGFDRLLASVAGSGINVRIHLEDGPPAQRILEVAAKEAADLLIVGTHGRTGLSRAIFGSVADRLVRQAPCPVLTVQPTLREVPRREIRRLCYATDFSPTARAAWPWVVAIARACGAQVDLVHVTFQPVPDRHLSAEALARMTHMLHEQGRTEAARFLAGSETPRDQIRLCLTHGNPGEQIVHRAYEQADDLIIMGTHGWSGVVRWMLGSVAHHVIQTAPCPVLTIAPTSPASHQAPAGVQSPGASR